MGVGQLERAIQRQSVEECSRGAAVRMHSTEPNPSSSQANSDYNGNLTKSASNSRLLVRQRQAVRSTQLPFGAAELYDIWKTSRLQRRITPSATLLDNRSGTVLALISAGILLGTISMASSDNRELGMSWTNDLTVAMPGTALLGLPSDILWALDQSYLAQEDQVKAHDDDDGNGYYELMSLRADLSHVQYRLDPHRWALERTRHGGSRPHLSC